MQHVEALAVGDAASESEISVNAACGKSWVQRQVIVAVGSNAMSREHFGAFPIRQPPHADLAAAVLAMRA